MTLPLLILAGCMPGEEAPRAIGTSPSAASPAEAETSAEIRFSPASSDDEPAAKPKLYEGLTLDEWRDRIKNLDPQDPASASAVPGLCAIARDTGAPWYTRRQAAQTLGRMGAAAAEAVPLLIGLLDEPSPEDESTFLWAVKALSLFGPVAADATPKLVAILRDRSSPAVHRQVCVDALARIGAAHADAIPALVEMLEARGEPPSQETTILRVLTAEALTLVGPGANLAVPALIRAARDDNDRLRHTAIQAIGAVGPSADPAVPTLVEAMAFDESPAVRDEAGAALAQIGSESLPALTHLLGDREAELRWRAAAALGEMGPPARPATDPLKLRLDDESPLVRVTAAEALWKITRDSRSVIPVTVELLTVEDRQLRMRAFRLLTGLGDGASEAVPALRRLLDDRRDYVRLAAEKSLEKITGRSPESP